MCWSKEVSIGTFGASLAGVIYLYKRNRKNDRWIALFALTISVIQLSEFFMWDNLPINGICNNINKFASILAIIVLALEPFTNIIGGLITSKSNKKLLYIMLILYVIFILFVYFTQIKGKNINWCGDMDDTCGIGNACHLKWNFTKTINGQSAIIWVIFLLAPFLAMIPLQTGLIYIAFGILALVLSKLMSNNKVFGSLWCWLAIGIIFIQIMI